MQVRDFLPFQDAKRGRPKKKAQLLNANEQKTIAKLFKSVGLAIGFTGGTYTGTRINFEAAPYNFFRITQAIDTDSYIKQAFNKYKELLWKEGFDILSENTEAVDYLHQRIDFMELSMRQSFNSFLIEIGDSLVKFSNAFAVKVRADLAPYFPSPLNPSGKKLPVVGYQIIPAETMEIMRDYHNNIILYRQNIWGANAGGSIAGFGGQPRQDNLLPTWRPEEVIHFVVDKKPGRIFGTPFLTSVMDDVVALRQIEEDIQNLIHRELFPLYKYKVGTELAPAEPGEIEQAAAELANLRSEGGLVLPDRHDVEVIGAEGKVMDVNPYLQHFKERVAVGLGLSQHHLGMMNEGANRSVTDRLDIALYDKVKTYQRYLSGAIRLEIFNELLVEGGFDPYKTPTETGKADRCLFRFSEIDVDSQAKIENLEIQKYAADIQTLEETRLALKKKPELDEERLYTAIVAKIQADMMPATGPPVRPGGSSGATTQSTPGVTPPTIDKSGGANNKPSSPFSRSPSQGVLPNPKAKPSKTASNITTPANQHGQRTSPQIRHDDYLDEIVDLLSEDDQEEV